MDKEFDIKMAKNAKNQENQGFFNIFSTPLQNFQDNVS